MNAPRPVLALLALGATAGLSACGAGATSAQHPSAPSLYTAANAADVWAHPASHRGARIDVRGTVEGAHRSHQGVVVALRVPGSRDAVAAHVFDRRFAVRRGERLHVVGAVRGPLGSHDVPGVKPFAPVAPGATVIDARAASPEA